MTIARMLSAMVTACLLAIFGVAGGGAAADGPPPNDDVGAAETISSVPYTTVSSNDAATLAGDDPAGCRASDQTVWYTYVAPADLSVQADTRGGSWSAVGAYTGRRGALSQVACAYYDARFSDPQGAHLALTSGTTYYFMVSGSGQVEFNLAELPPPIMVSVVVHRGWVTRTGRVTFGGQVTCNQPTAIELFVDLKQTTGPVAAQDHSWSAMTCSSSPTTWTQQFSSWTGTAFRPGRLGVNYYVPARNTFWSAYVTGQQGATLSAAKP